MFRAIGLVTELRKILITVYDHSYIWSFIHCASSEAKKPKQFCGQDLPSSLGGIEKGRLVLSPGAAKIGSPYSPFHLKMEV